MAKISKNIKKLRCERKLTQDLLAEKINVTRQTISSWENDRTQPDIEMLEILAKAFDVGIEELIYGEKRNVGLEASKPDRRKAMIIVFATLGSLLMATGLIIVLVSFWDKLPEYFLAALSFIPLLLGGGLALRTKIKKPNSIGWCEGSSVAWVAGVIATLTLIVSLFSIHLSFDTIYIGLALLVLPIGFILNSAFPLVVYYAITTIYVVGNSFNVFSFIAGILMVGAGFAFILKQSPDDYRRKISLWSVIVSVATILVFRTVESAECNGNTAVLIIVSGILTALYSADKGEKTAYPFRYICVPAIAALMCLICVETEDCLQGGYYFDDVKLLFPGMAPFVSAVIIAVGIFVGKSSLKNNPTKKAFIALSCLTVLICTVSAVVSAYMTSLFVDILNIVMIVISLLTGITIIISGVKKAKLLTVNLGIIMVCFIIYLTIFAGKFDVVYSGIGCIIMGGILLLINYKLSKSFKETEGDKNA